MNARTPRTLGVLVSAAETAANDMPPCAAGMDMRSGVDLAETLEALGHRPRLFDVADHFDADAAARELDGCILALHGPLGGSGQLQARMSAARLGYVGPSAEHVATAYDKWRCRQLLRWHNVPVPASCVLSTGKERAAEPIRNVTGAADRAGARYLATDMTRHDAPVRWPCVLKPRRGSHGAGHVYIDSQQGLADGLSRAQRTGATEFVLERHVAGIEIQVVLFAGEVMGSMQLDGELMIIPPTTSPSRLVGIHNLARRAAEALSLTTSICRVDVLVHPRDNEFVLEVEPLPPLHRESVVTRVARAAGLSYPRLIQQLVSACPQHRHTSPPSGLPTAHAS